MARRHSSDSDSSDDSRQEKGLLSSDDEQDDAEPQQSKSWIWWIVGALILAVVIALIVWMYSSGRLGGSSDDATTSAGSTAAADSEASPTAGGSATGGSGGTGGATSAAAASGGAGSGSGGAATDAAGSSKEAVSGIAAAVSGNAATAASGGGGAGATATKAATGGGEEKTAEAPKPTTSTLDTATLPIFTAVVGVRNPTTTAEPAAATAPTTTYDWPASSSAPPTATPSGASTLHVDFSDYNSVDKSLKDFLGDAGLLIADWDVTSDPISYSYKTDNLAVVDGELHLTVPKPDDSPEKTSGAQIYTKASDIGYGFFTTRARLTPVAGVRQNIVYTASEYSGIAAGFRSTYYSSTQGERGVTPGVALTVQNDTAASMTFGEYRDDPSEAFHDYGIYWSPGNVQFFVDSEEKTGMDMHVPTHPGLISWSNWANGGAQWSGTGLPSEDAAYRIEWIDGWWLNTEM